MGHVRGGVNYLACEVVRASLTRCCVVEDFLEERGMFVAGGAGHVFAFAVNECALAI